MKKVKLLVAQFCPTLQSHGLSPTRLLCPWDSPSKNSGVGSHSLLPVFFPTQGMNSGLLHSRQILYCLSHQGSPSTIYIGPKVKLLEFEVKSFETCLKFKFDSTTNLLTRVL